MTTDNTQHDPHDKHMTDHNYDGIQELDNPPPIWIMALFYITIGFSIIYGAYYFWLKQGDHQDAEYIRKSETHNQKYRLQIYRLKIWFCLPMLLRWKKENKSTKT